MSESLALAREFAFRAEMFIDWFDKTVFDEKSSVNMRRLHEVLGLLQAAAARLKGVVPDDEDIVSYKNNQDAAGILRKKLPVDEYSVVFDPLEHGPPEGNQPQPVVATIANDVTDIYRDVMEGLLEYRAGRVQNALWNWHFLYYAHSGRHLTHAQSAIWQYLSQENWRPFQSAGKYHGGVIA